jgi:stage V sporulation protein D (sporulation-specific penicillin-binding protein)
MGEGELCLTAPKVTNKKRLLFLLMGVTLIFFILIGRLAYVQLVWGVDLQKKALSQWTRELPVAPKRGIIYDRNGNVLAQSASAETVAARPNQIKDPKKAAQMLAPVLEMPEEDIYKKISDKKKSEVWIKRQISKEMANKVRELDIKGIVFTEESKRYYPNKNLASHIIGFTGVDGEGQEGIELFYDKQLKGFQGKIVTETDVRGRTLPYNVSRYIPPENGWNLVLTIDQTIQHFAEKAVADAMEHYKAKKVYCIIMEPNTGEILAIANRPDFDPNDPPRNLDFNEMQKYIKNISVKDNLDPGSTFKILTAASGLQDGVVSLDSTFDCPGYKMVDGQRIKCWKAGGHGHEDFKKAVQNSCNPVFMEIALRLGTDKFYKYMDAFGLGQKTGIDILGEEQGVVMNKSRVKNVDLARMGFGQAIAVTPIQLVNAVSAVINGGNLMEPHLAKEFKDEEGNVIEEIKPKKVRQVISAENSRIMCDILESVVSEGGGKNAYIPGYRIGGKTGTAQKYGENGKIMQGKHISSFIGFAPAEAPQVVVLFMVDEPQTPVDFGSVVAAPYVKMILEDTLKYLEVEPIFDEDTEEYRQMVEVPNVIGLPLTEAAKQLKDAKLNYIGEETGTIVEDQMPKPGAEVMVDTTVLLYMKRENAKNAEQGGSGRAIVPDLAGKSIREANQLLSSVGLKMTIQGSGIAVSQQPEAGEEVDKGSTVTVKFDAPEEE